MRQAYAHIALLQLAPDGDERAPGASITVALCGHWDHPPPCPLAPHHTAAVRDGDRLALRILFSVEPEKEHDVRRLIDAALASGELHGPEGRTTSWTLVETASATVRADEVDHARRLAAS